MIDLQAGLHYNDATTWRKRLLCGKSKWMPRKTRTARRSAYMEELKVEVGGICFDGQGMLFAGFNYNGLFYWDIVKNKIHMLGNFEKDPLWRGGRFYVIVQWKTFFFFPLFRAYGIPYFDIQTREIEYCDIPHCLEDKILNYCGYVKKDNFIYMFPAKLSETVLVLNMEQKKITEIIYDWSKNIINRFKGDSEQCMNGFWYHGEKIWISYMNAQEIYEISLDSWEIHTLSWKEIEYPIILRSNTGNIWIEDQGKSMIYCVDELGCIIERYALMPEGDFVDLQLFNRVVEVHNNIKFVLPFHTDKIFLIDADGNIQQKQIGEGSDCTAGCYLCFHYLEFEDEIWFLPHSQNDIIIVNLRNGSISYKKMPTPDNWAATRKFMIKMRHCEKRSIIGESVDDIFLQDFCDYIIHKKEHATEKNITSNYGKKLWKTLSGTIDLCEREEMYYDKSNIENMSEALWS